MVTGIFIGSKHIKESNKTMKEFMGCFEGRANAVIWKRHEGASKERAKPFLTAANGSLYNGS